MSTASVIVLIVYAIALVCLGYWDLRRTFSRIAHDRRPHLDPVDFAGEIKAYRLSRDTEEAEERRVSR